MYCLSFVGSPAGKARRRGHLHANFTSVDLSLCSRWCTCLFQGLHPDLPSTPSGTFYRSPLPVSCVCPICCMVFSCSTKHAPAPPLVSQYENRKDMYITNFWASVDWPRVATHYAEASGEVVPEALPSPER